MDEPLAPRWGRWSRGKVVGVTLLAFLVALTLIVQRSRHTSVPYPESAAAPSVTLQVVPAAQVQQRLDSLAGSGRLTAVAPPGAAQTLVGQLTLTAPSSDTATPGEYALFVIDRATHSVVPTLTGVGPVGTRVTSGWNSHYAGIAAQVPWLTALKSGTAASQGQALSFVPHTPGPITVQIVLDTASPTVTDPSAALTVALVYLDPAGHVYWAADLTS